MFNPGQRERPKTQAMKKIIRIMKKEMIAIIGSIFGIIITSLLTIITIGGQAYIDEQSERSRRQEDLNIELVNSLRDIQENCSNRFR